MSSAPDVVRADRSALWQSDDEITVARQTPCLTEMSAVGLIGGAAGLSALLWLAIFVVI
ncbi:hypothetical protein ROA7450_04168 [Roseovarius albus]|uniref:Uncharacterized protein n=1 Tax=Roseovarius albus TaxID=1247867 RepID=A0A1X7AA42_9RHOB|nr:hypothetical protein [Roseovarius albus]SLN73732.1 hypothetical protein ROA7450_04168 [Roseovarius albus]